MHFKGECMNILLTIFLFLSLPTSYADLSAVAEDLNDLAAENEALLNTLNEEALKLDEEKLKLEEELKLKETRLEEIKVKKESEIKPVETNINEQIIYSILHLKKIGSCEVMAGELPGEYIVKNNEFTVRFIFASFESNHKPIAKLTTVEFGQQSVIEIHQPEYTPTDIKKPSMMTATLRFDPTTHVMNHATFRGQKINDSGFGFLSSYDPHQITCLL